jgi:hypothetical protein
MPIRLLIMAIFFVFGTAGCSTGFGEPCEVPQTVEFRRACTTFQGEDDGTGSAVQMQSSASCALENFAGCETRVCLVYRGSSPFCSLRCESDGSCEGSGRCVPLLANVERDCCDPAVRANQARCAGFLGQCYCVREVDFAESTEPDVPDCVMDNDCQEGSKCCDGICILSDSACGEPPPMSMEPEGG